MFLAFLFCISRIRLHPLQYCVPDTRSLQCSVMKPRFSRSLSTFAVVLVIGVFACGLSPVWAQTKIDYKKAVPILQPMKVGAPTPDFNLTTPEGKKISLKDFRGKIVLLNFWASWCVPCREEMPAMEKLYQEYKD